MRKMQAYVYVEKHPHQACPAAWKEGETALTPSEDMVGRVADFMTNKQD